MTRVELNGEAIDGWDAFHALIDGVAAVNRRQVEAGEVPALHLVLRQGGIIEGARVATARALATL